jgi:DNA helicase-2/ATP-dependent DNA helicase PcrA
VVQNRFSQSVVQSRFIHELGAAAVSTGVAPRIRMPEEVAAIQVDKCATCGSGLVTPLEHATLTCSKCPDRRDLVLLDNLTAWRDQTATELNQISWLLLSDVTLSALAALRPANVQELSQISGMRSARIEQFGDDILQLINSL